MLCGATTMRPPFKHIGGLRLVSYVDNFTNHGKSVLHMRIGVNRTIKHWLKLENYNTKLDSYWMKQCKFDIINILQAYDKGNSKLVINTLALKHWKREKIEEDETCYRIKYRYDFIGGKITLPHRKYIIMTTTSLVWALKKKNEFIEIPLVNLEKITLKS